MGQQILFAVVLCNKNTEIISLSPWASSIFLDSSSVIWIPQKSSLSHGQVKNKINQTDI